MRASSMPSSAAFRPVPGLSASLPSANFSVVPLSKAADLSVTGFSVPFSIFFSTSFSLATVLSTATAFSVMTSFFALITVHFTRRLALITGPDGPMPVTATQVLAPA